AVGPVAVAGEVARALDDVHLAGHPDLVGDQLGGVEAAAGHRSPVADAGDHTVVAGLELRPALGHRGLVADQSLAEVATAPMGPPDAVGVQHLTAQLDEAAVVARPPLDAPSLQSDGGVDLTSVAVP